MEISPSNHEELAECVIVGEAMADLVGIGIIVGFVGQAIISLILATWVFFLSKYGNLEVVHPEGTVEHAMERKRLESVADILMVGNDFQMLLGTSYMISVFVSAGKLDSYHLHLIFDIVSFVGVSSAAALVCWTFCNAKMASPQHHPTRRHSKRSAHFTRRHRVTYFFAVMFLALTILLYQRLGQWSPDHEPGRCYHTYLVSKPGARHPYSDKIYVLVTAGWMLFVMLAAAFLGARWRRSILVLAFLQVPVHLYMMLALRSANQGKLSGEEKHENGWDFGQTTSVVLLVLALNEVVTKGREYFAFEHDLRKNGLHKYNSNGGKGGGKCLLEEVEPAGDLGSYELGVNKPHGDLVTQETVASATLEVPTVAPQPSTMFSP